MLQAYSSKCTHYGAPLANGHLEGGLIRWPLFQDRDKYPKLCLSGQSEVCCQVPLARCLFLCSHRRHRGLPGSGQSCLTSGDRRHIEELHDGENRLGICRDRRDRRSCKIFVRCVNFSRKQRSSYIFCKFTHI